MFSIPSVLVVLANNFLHYRTLYRKSFFIKIAVPMLIRLHKILVTYFHYSFIPLHFINPVIPIIVQNLF